MIKIICVGKIKEKYLKEAVLEYQKRISKYTKLELIELPDYDFDIKKTLSKEKDNILKVIKPNDYNILRDFDGQSFTSLEFASKLLNLREKYPNINFIIGGSFGVDTAIKEKCQERISFSKLTFPHQLFRVIFLEQIYRSFKIINNEEYHK